MDVEETKKIIQSKIKAEAATKNVRSNIKSYIHEKQNVREGFKESFEPLISSQDKVKESIDKEQNELIKQLQENQLALTQGLDKNRLAITQGFGKMDEIKKWDLQQLPGYEAIEEPEAIEEIEEKEPEEPEEVRKDENTIYKISYKDLNKIAGFKKYSNEDEDEVVGIKKKVLHNFINYHGFHNQNKYEIKIVDPNERLLKVVEKPVIITYDKNEMDKNLMNKETADLLFFYDLKLPSEYKDAKLKEIQEAYEKSIGISSKLKETLKNVAVFNDKINAGKSIAFPKSKRPKPETLENIAEYNILEIYNYNHKLSQGI